MRKHRTRTHRSQRTQRSCEICPEYIWWRAVYSKKHRRRTHRSQRTHRSCEICPGFIWWRALHFKKFPIKKISKKMRKQFIDVIKDLKSTRSLWKIYLMFKLYWDIYDKTLKKKCLFIAFMKQLLKKLILMYLLKKSLNQSQERYGDLDN